MKDFFQRFAGPGDKPSGGDAAQRLTLAAFGKHPGWDDHIPGIGVDTEALAQLKQTLYVSGIGAQIDTGVWEKLESEKRLVGFDHTFLWLRARHTVYGLLWSSTDRKGRSKYPMVVCVDGENVTPWVMLTKVRPELERLRDACQRMSSAEQVTAECRSAQERLQALVNEPAENRGENQLPLEIRRHFLEHRQLGPERLGLLRVLHELREVSGILAGARAKDAGALKDLRPSHLRVPLTSELRSEGVLLWSTFLKCVVPESVPILLISRAAVDWLDAVIGEASGDDFFCLQAAPNALPLATQIPYDLSPELQLRLIAIEEKFLGGKATAVETPKATAAESPSPLPGVPVPKPPADIRSRARRWWVLVVVGLVLCAAGIWFWLGTRELNRSGPSNAAPPVAATGAGNEGPVKQPVEADSLRVEQNYQNVLREGRAALDAKDFAAAVAKADEALKLKGTDPAAIQLKTNAQAGLDAAANRELEQNLQAVLKEGQAAFERKDYATAMARAEEGLKLKAGDAAATQLKNYAVAQLNEINAARQKEERYQGALKEGLAALDAKDYARAMAQAEEALKTKPADNAATQLNAEAEKQLAAVKVAHEREQKYLTTLKSAQTAFDRKDFPTALTQAEAALQVKSGDAAATKIKNDATVAIRDLNAAREQEQKYQTAMQEGEAALKEKDFARAVTAADRALMHKPDDSAAIELQKRAKQARDEQELRTLDAKLEVLLVWFGVLEPKDAKTPEARNQKRVVGELGIQRETYLREAENLENQFKSRGWLEQDDREGKLNALKKNIRDRL